MKHRRSALIFAIGGFALFINLAPANSHSQLVSSDPVDGSVLSAAPAKVVLTFNEALLEETVAVAISTAPVPLSAAPSPPRPALLSPSLGLRNYPLILTPFPIGSSLRTPIRSPGQLVSRTPLPAPRPPSGVRHQLLPPLLLQWLLGNRELVSQLASWD